MTHDKMVEAARDEMLEKASAFWDEDRYNARKQRILWTSSGCMADFATEQVEPFATALRALVEALENPDEFDEILEMRKAQAKALLADTPLTGE
jgi:hypothetical protein